MNTFRASPCVAFFSLLCSLVLLQACSDPGSDSLLSSSSTTRRPSPILLKSPRTNTGETALQFDYRAIFPKAAGNSDLVLAVDCTNDALASKLLGIDPKTIRTMAFEDYQSSNSTLVADKSNGWGIERPLLSCAGDMQRQAFKPYIQAETRKHYLAVNEAEGKFISIPASCEGLKAGVELRKLQAPYSDNLAQLIMNRLAPRVEEEIELNCSHWIDTSPNKINWQLGYTDQGELVAVHNNLGSVTAFLIEAIDKVPSMEFLEAILSPDAPEMSPFSRTSYTLETLKRSMGFSTLESFGTLSDIKDLVTASQKINDQAPILQLDICVLDCGESFVPEHKLGDTTISLETLSRNRDINGDTVVLWKFAAEAPAMKFAACQYSGFYEFLGLNMHELDWSQSKLDEDWLLGAEQAAKQSSKAPIACMDAAYDICEKTVDDRTALTRPSDLANLFSMKNCGEQAEASTLAIRLLKSVNLNMPLEITLDSLRANVPGAQASKLRISGESAKKAVGFKQALSCSNRSMTCPNTGEAVSGLRFRGPIQVELNQVNIDRELPAEPGFSFGAVEALAGAELSIRNSRLGLGANSSGFDLGVKADGSQLFLVNTEILARRTAVEASSSRVVAYGTGLKRPLIAPKAEPQAPAADAVTDALAQEANAPLKLAVADFNLGGQQSATFIQGIRLGGPYAVRTVGRALVTMRNVEFRGSSAVGQESRAFRDTGSRARIVVTDGSFSGFDKLLFVDSLDPFNDKFNFTLLMSTLDFNSGCVSDDRGDSVKFIPEEHLMVRGWNWAHGAPKQTNVIVVNNSCGI